MAERKTVTPSEVILVVMGGPPKNSDLKASRAGIEAHRVVRERIESGRPPKCLEGICQRSPKFEQRNRKEIGPDGLEISARVDISTRFAVVEVKPVPITGRHLLQAAIEADVAGKDNVVVYGYEDGGYGEGVMVVVRNADDLTGDIEEICREARRILDLQEQIDEERTRSKRGGKSVREVIERNRGDMITFVCEIGDIGRASGAHRKGLCFEIVEERREFDRRVESVMSELRRRAKY